MSNKHHDLLGVPKHANQHRLSRLTMEVHTDELRIMASAVESYTDELIAALEAAEKQSAERLEALDNRISELNTMRYRIKTLSGTVDIVDGQRDRWMARCKEAQAKLETADKRIAELEAREVKLPERYEVEMCPTPSPDGEWYSREDVLAALAKAGVRIYEEG
ncbi:TPA: hypothetical protein ACOEAX_004283 [Enterobacter bugandensis]